MPYRDPRIAADARARALVALDRDEALEPPETARDERRATLARLVILGAIAAVVTGAGLAVDRAPAAPPEPLARRGDVAFVAPATVVASGDARAASVGDRCEIAVFDAGERDGGQTCILELTCPSFEQRSAVTGCTLDRSSLRADAARLVVDLHARRVVSHDPLGAIELRVDVP